MYAINISIVVFDYPYIPYIALINNGDAAPQSYTTLVFDFSLLFMYI